MKDVALSADGIPVAFEVHGTGAPALVFVHGWSCNRTYWSGQVDHFAEHHHVIAIDLAGTERRGRAASPGRWRPSARTSSP